MSRLLEILGRAITVDTAELIWHWLQVVRLPQGKSDPAELQQLHRILELAGQMKIESAREQVRLHLFEDPSCIWGRMASAAICLHDNRLDEAIEELNSVYVRQPSNTMSLYALGHCYERLGKEAEAVEFYQDCLKFKNHLQLPAERLAAIYFKNCQIAKTIQQYELLKNEYSDDLSTLVTLGHLYMAAGRHDEAIASFDAAILMHPDNFHAQDEQLEQLIEAGDMEDALDRCENLSQARPESVELLLKRADILNMMGQTTEAIAQYEEAVRLCPDFLEATIKLGTVYLQQQQDQLAAQHFNQAVEINDKIVDAYIGLATAQKQAGHTSEAIATVQLAGAIQPNSSMLFAETAKLHFRESSFPSDDGQTIVDDSPLLKLVIDAHRQQLIHHPQDPDLHYRLGILLASIGQLPDAAKTFQAAVCLNPLHHRALTRLAITLCELGDTNATLANLPTQLAPDPDTLDLHYRTALLYCNRVKFAATLLNLHRQLDNNYATADPTVNISIVLQNLGLLDRPTATWDSLEQTANAMSD